MLLIPVLQGKVFLGCFQLADVHGELFAAGDPAASVEEALLQTPLSPKGALHLLVQR